MSDIDLSRVFNADPRAVGRVMGGGNRGYYIPAYQRPYAWSPTDIERLMTSVMEGVGALEEMDDAITFIGTFIFIHDKDYTTVEPQVRNELPDAVYLVIDGQQRLTTIALLAIALHQRLHELGRYLATHKSIGEDASNWIVRQLSEVSSKLEPIFIAQQGWGESPFNQYPRIIRAYEDSWSQKADQAEYNSPVARLIWSYIKHLQTDGSNSFEYAAATEEEGHHADFAARFRHTVKRLGKLIEERHQSSDSDERLPDLANLLDLATKDAGIIERLFRISVPDEVAAVWRMDSSSLKLPQRRLRDLSRLIMFARYLAGRLAVTEVTVNKEEYAFDMFEALNTTGEPLTAFETFRPAVIRSEDLKDFKGSPSALFLAPIEDFLGRQASRRRQRCNELMIPFALFHSGKKLGKHLSTQRNWLRHAYDDAGDQDGKREFVRSMAAVAHFLTDCWEVEDWHDLLQNLKSRLALDQKTHADVTLALRVLRAAKHEITVGVLARFYAEVLWADDEQVRAKAAREFADAALATVAFFALWRGSRVGTENIDTVYRALMSKEQGIGPERTDGPFVGPFMVAGGNAPTASALRSHFLAELKRKQVATVDTWAARARDLAVYEQSVPLTRLLLLAAGHDAIPSTAEPGLLANGRTGVSNMLTPSRWEDDLTIEHVAPSNPREAADWSNDIYTEDAHQCLGNLTLLPHAVNSSVSNRPWSEKHTLYRMLCASSLEDAKSIVLDAADHGINLPEPTQELLANARHAPQLTAIALLGGTGDEWSLEFIRKRSHNLAHQAWRQLAPWLGIDHEFLISDQNPDGKKKPTFSLAAMLKNELDGEDDDDESSDGE